MEIDLHFFHPPLLVLWDQLAWRTSLAWWTWCFCKSVLMIKGQRQTGLGAVKPGCRLDIQPAFSERWRMALITCKLLYCNFRYLSNFQCVLHRCFLLPLQTNGTLSDVMAVCTEEKEAAFSWKTSFFFFFLYWRAGTRMLVIRWLPPIRGNRRWPARQIMYTTFYVLFEYSCVCNLQRETFKWLNCKVVLIWLQVLYKGVTG